MAEGLFRDEIPDVQVFSAGLSPWRVDPNVIQLLEREGRRTDTLISKHLRDLTFKPDAIIVLDARVMAALMSDCYAYLHDVPILLYPIDDPYVGDFLINLTDAQRKCYNRMVKRLLALRNSGIIHALGVSKWTK